MKVKAKYSDCKSINNIAKYGYFKESKMHITRDRVYDVHAIAVFEGIPMLQIINDIDYPDWVASIFFEMSDTLIPNDWICNILTDEGGQPVLVSGPEFLAKDASSYDRMVDLEPTEVNLFWERIKSLEKKDETC